ncbi:hypothetical protein HHL11_07125 [Ramlibacter sp. G-1-2-2]|uniref:Uncharacterized protein n=1 Tax=Ramlibacter agri TaxID=2728837 RepID=A0A848GYW6_9BURK|nr:hypothetical protein [Ramlibacter agri]NML43514.1 hypothetical protein [Ramlibacter agri]
MTAVTIAQICATAGVSPRLYSMVAKVHRLGCGELWAQLVAGKVSAHLALQICSLDHAGQQHVLAEMAPMRARERTQFVQRVLAIATKPAEVA